MDHHCAFVSNCVGGDNYKYFVQFLLYTVLSLAYCCVLIAGRGWSLRFDAVARTQARAHDAVV
eukprot:CAMPEP_0198352174 /NCGR_PEP_ID=MMETSP1450-20131203/106006_1 /TAXON_ID=753684 ORGANISM="Madagascaria erythrocladiodes, Strain CCMP3234" /NCGR_SAMPLE_ID=MMETSP1450 /ASSEMBLY_ACC=CAM_ASM_001115 /LENGTH=62 /DNA_ID=CAMNT_0044058183 /DNA_START=35 /DNA_END=220 /DNA_ORIENTATION=+